MSETNSCILLKNHLVICGGGITATHIIAELDSYKTMAEGQENQLGTGIFAREYLLIDTDEERCKHLKKKYKHMNYIIGDATDDDILEKASIKQAYGVFTVLPNDKDNLFVTFTVKHKNPKIRIVSRTTDVFNTGQKLFKAGANSVISPNFIGGLRMVSEAARPDVTAFLDEMLRNKSSDLHIHEIKITEQSRLSGKTLKDLKLTSTYKVIVIAIEDSSRKSGLSYNPDPATTINPGQTIIVFGQGADIRKLEELS